ERPARSAKPLKCLPDSLPAGCGTPRAPRDRPTVEAISQGGSDDYVLEQEALHDGRSARLHAHRIDDRRRDHRHPGRHRRSALRQYAGAGAYREGSGGHPRYGLRRLGRERGTRRAPRMMVPRMTSLENAPSRSEALPRPLGFIASPATPGLAGRALSVALAARVPLLIALVTFVVFSPALWNHFVDWDDQVNFLTNNDYRGLGWTHIRW